MHDLLKSMQLNESTTGGARGTTHGSCLPPTWSLIDFFFFMSTLFCILEIDDAGLNAILIVIGIPFEIPPKIPPELLVFVETFPLSLHMHHYFLIQSL